MTKSYIVEKALLQNNVCEDDTVVVKTETTIRFSIHLLRLLVLLLCNFFLKQEIEEDKSYDFIMQNFQVILDIVITELEIALFDFLNFDEEKFVDEIELNCRDETMLALIIQSKVNEKLKKLGEK